MSQSMDPSGQQSSKGLHPAIIAAIITATIGAIATLVYAGFNYLGTKYQTDRPIEVTSRAETALAKKEYNNFFATNLPLYTQAQLELTQTAAPAVQDSVVPSDTSVPANTVPIPETKTLTAKREPPTGTPEISTQFLATQTQYFKSTQTLSINPVSTGQFYNQELIVAILDVSSDGKVSLSVSAPDFEPLTFNNQVKGSIIEYVTDKTYHIKINDYTYTFTMPYGCVITVQDMGHDFPSAKQYSSLEIRSKPIRETSREDFFNNEITVEVLGSDRNSNSVSFKVTDPYGHELILEDRYVGYKTRFQVYSDPLQPYYEIQILDIDSEYPKDLVTMIVYKMKK